MIRHSPEQVEVQKQQSRNPLAIIGGLGFKLISGGISFSEWREWKYIEKQSKLYVDAIFSCWLKGLMTIEEQEKAYKYGIKEMGLNSSVVIAQATYRTISTYLGEKDKHLDINWKLYKRPTQENLT